MSLLRLELFSPSEIEVISIIGEDGHGHQRMDDSAIPVPIGLRKIITHEWIINSHQHLAETVDVILFPSRFCVPQYLCGIT